ncbi:hypothetical protein BKL49_09325 [Rodentibacter myodis]|uniref:EF-hand domain-containing protein n=2 Tax=Rodentibacter myodis TaxID=1907939 RepID=A0A1V3JLE8_9PAST|nr:hypothetical protein BKL49_09325 [Rodentibacter myodis]
MKKSSNEQEYEKLLSELREIIHFLGITQNTAVEMIEEYYSKHFEFYDTNENNRISIDSFKKILQGRKGSSRKLRIYIDCLKQSEKYHKLIGLDVSENGDVEVLGEDRKRELHQLSEYIRDLVIQRENT